jgi:hypothetical protein
LIHANEATRGRSSARPGGGAVKPEVRRSADQVGRLLADDFIEFGSSGRVFDKAQVIEALKQEAPDPAMGIVLTDFSARQLAPGVMLVTYRTHLSAPNAPAGYTLRSSIWTLRQGRWQMVFHQGTPGANSGQG